MIKHILKNMWISRRNNGWILLELFVVSLFLWFSIDYLYTNIRNLNRPLGFDPNEIYWVGLGDLEPESNLYDPSPEHTKNVREDFLFILQRIKEHPLVEEVCCTYFYPVYKWSTWGSSISYDTVGISVKQCQVTPAYFDVFRVKTRSGRSAGELFSQGDGKELICTENTARELFGSAVPLGKKVWVSALRDSLTLVDICEDQKMMDYDDYTQAFYYPLLFRPEDKISLEFVPDIYFRVKKGMDYKDLASDFRNEMSSRLQIGNLYLHEVEPLSNLREYMVQENVNVFNIFITVIVFFLINIFLGVLGIFWFCTQHRRHEIGLRLALGSTRGQVRRLLIWEGLFLLAIVFVPALIISYHIYQADFISSPFGLSGIHFIITQLLALGLLIGMLISGLWVPAHRAMNTQPAEVLHEE